MNQKPMIRSFPVADRWCVHSYYTLCPYAPDGTGRILVAGCELSSGMGEVMILSSDGAVLSRFGRQPVTPSFWHTGFWQSWSPDGDAVYYQSGSLREPFVVRRELSTGHEDRLAGDLEGIPPSGEPGISCAHGLLYAAGYGDGVWKPDASPVPFGARDQHGLFELDFRANHHRLVLTTADILARHPFSKLLREADQRSRERLGPNEGLTLMTYCVRWNLQGTRFLFFLGNHCVVKERQEPSVKSVFTADRSLADIHLAIDLSFGKVGVHWSWQPDGEMLIGYGPRPDDPTRLCLAEVRYDGTGYRWLSDHASGGHPSVSPRDRELIISDEGGLEHGSVVFIKRGSGQVFHREVVPKFLGQQEPPGRNSLRVCHHPVFNAQGDKILCNSLPGRDASLIEIQL